MKRLVLTTLLCATLSSCSLFKISLSSGDKAMSHAERNLRVATRAFYGTFNSKIINAADSINSSTKDVVVMLNATRWKLYSTSAATSAVFQTDPNVAMVNLWVLCNQMDAYMKSAPDSLLFSKQTPIALNTCEYLSSEVKTVARKTMSNVLYSKMNDFVLDYCKRHKPKSVDVLTSDLALEWMNFISADSAQFNTSTGTMPEVLNDMTERMSGYAQQYSNSLTWTKDMIEMKFRQDSISLDLMAQLDSLTTDFRRITIIMQNSPEMVDKVSSDLNAQFATMITTLNRTINVAFANFDSQRVQLQQFISQEREVILKEASKAAQESIDTAMARLPGMVAKLMTAIIVAMIVLFSLPFALGYFLGKYKARKKEEEDNKE